MMKKAITNFFVVVMAIATGLLILCMCFSLVKNSRRTVVTAHRDLSELGNIAIRISACNSINHPQTLGLFAMEKYVEEQSLGKIEVNIYPNGQLGSEEMSLEQVQSGTLEMCTASLAPITVYQNKFQVMDIPFLFGSYEEAWLVLGSYVGEELMATLEEVNMKGLAWMENGFRHTTTASKPIASISDFSGVKLRTMAAPMHILNFQTIGANPTPVPFSELYMALSQKIVDGQENPIANVWDLNMYEVQKALTLTGHIYDTMPLIANLDWWNSLPAEYQTIIIKGALIGQNYSRFCNYEREDLLKELLQEKGMTVLDPDDSVKEEMRAATQGVVTEAVRESIGGEYVDAFFAGMEEVLSDVTKGVN